MSDKCFMEFKGKDKNRHFNTSLNRSGIQSLLSYTIKLIPLRIFSFDYIKIV